MKFISGRLAVLALVPLVALGGCGSASRQVARDGKSAGGLVWPSIADATPMHRGGTEPSPGSLRDVQAGLTKDQIVALIGRPHFDEGAAGAREWNYVFNLGAPDGDASKTCQFKVLFDVHMVARSFYWKPQSCADLVEPTLEQRYSLSADALFPFNKSSIDDITPQGREQLDKLARRVEANGNEPGMVHVIGYSDRLGSADHNDRLSRHRAYAVMGYLVRRGVPSSVIVAEGRGSVVSVATDCDDGGDRATLITCLAPDRRVEVIVVGR